MMIFRYGFITILAVFQVRCLKPEGCDPNPNGGFREGILGQVGMFPWLGVIRVQLYEGEKIRTALTGAILINEKYALANADDIARIPDRIFQRDTQALFIPNDGEPWLCRLKNYTTHPEYPTVLNTIALVELELEDNKPAPLVPICWSTKFDVSNEMYVFGITDANDILEKEAYKVQYVQPTKCRLWYRNEGLETESDRRRGYQCAGAVNSKKRCVYETGMVLASNATGPWVLLGFGVYGPGCASPARFIEMHKYLPWLEAVTSNRVPDLREKTSHESRDIPTHQLFRSNMSDAELEMRIIPWVFDRYESGLVPEINRIDQDAILLFNKKYELMKGDCTKTSKLIYTDSIKVYADNSVGKAHYQLSLMDLSLFNYTCVLIRVDTQKRKKAKLWYDYGSFIETLEGAEETPSNLVKKYLIPKRQTTATTTTTQKPKRVGRRIINNNSRYKKLISDSLINDLQEIKNELETTRKDLNKTGTADIDRTFRKIFAIKGQLTDVRDKLGGPAPDSLKYSIDILDKAGSELRAGRIYYQGQLLNVKKQEVQKSLDLINQFRENPETSLEIEVATTVEPDPYEEVTKQPKAKERQGQNKPWIPHDLLEPQYITDRPGWWLYYPHINLDLEFQWESEAELIIEVWSHFTRTPPTRGPKYDETTRTRNMTVEKAEALAAAKAAALVELAAEEKAAVDAAAAATATGGDGSGGGTGRGGRVDDVSKLSDITIPPGLDLKDPPSDVTLPARVDEEEPQTPTPERNAFGEPKNRRPKKYLNFLIKDPTFRTYAERKGADFNELKVINIRGVDLYDEEATDASNSLRLERLCALAVVFCIILRHFVFN